MLPRTFASSPSCHARSRPSRRLSLGAPSTAARPTSFALSLSDAVIASWPLRYVTAPSTTKRADCGDRDAITRSDGELSRITRMRLRMLSASAGVAAEPLTVNAVTATVDSAPASRERPAAHTAHRPNALAATSPAPSAAVRPRTRVRAGDVGADGTAGAAIVKIGGDCSVSGAIATDVGV